MFWQVRSTVLRLDKIVIKAVLELPLRFVLIVILAKHFHGVYCDRSASPHTNKNIKVKFLYIDDVILDQRRSIIFDVFIF